MKKIKQKSVQDFKGYAMPVTQQKAAKGGNDSHDLSLDSVNFIITDDLMDN